MHFLDSPEQGLLVIPLFTDILPNGGGTWICDEGPARIGKWLVSYRDLCSFRRVCFRNTPSRCIADSERRGRADKVVLTQYDHPNGVGPRMTPVPQADDPTLSFFNNTVQTCPSDSFHEMTGEVGDVVLLHPLMLHSASKNGRRLARIITNPPVSLKEPFNFDRADASEYSLVELKTIQEVGGQDKLRGWKITGAREAVVPERLKVQAKWLAEENERLQRQGVQYEDPTQMSGPAHHQAARDMGGDRSQRVAVA